jgi:hypothetical protein
MSSHSFQVFKTPKDRHSWKKLAEFVRLHPELTAAEKQAIRDALEYMSSTLGKNFLSATSEFNHFLYQHFRNLAPWALKWSVWFSQALADLVANDTNGKLLSDLKSKHRHEEALTYLEINHYLKQAGFLIRFEEEVTVGEGSRFPDLMLKNPETREVVYLELSSLHMHQEHDWNQSTFHKLSNYFSQGMLEMQLNYCGKLRNLTRTNAEEVKQLIDAFKKSIDSGDKLYTVENEFMILGVASESHGSELQQWARAHDIQLNSVSGESITLEGEISRIRKKVKDKARQLGQQHFNIIAISVHPLFMMAGDKISMLIDLVGYLEQFQHLYGVMVFGHNPMSRIPRNPDQQPLADWHLEAFGHLLSARTVADLRTTEFYFARNMASQQPTVHTQEMFYNAFRFGQRIEPEAPSETLR